MSAAPEKRERPTVDKWASEKLEAGEPISHPRQIRETGHWRLAAWVHKERKRGANIKTLRGPGGIAVYVMPGAGPQGEMFEVGGDAENTAQGTASKTDDEATDEEGHRHAR
jgi:hypothetical protein